MRKRGQLLAHIQNTRAQYIMPAFERRLAYPANRDGVSAQFADPSVRKSIDVDLALIDQYDTLIVDLELTSVREAKRHDADAFHRLRSVPGIGKVARPKRTQTPIHLRLVVDAVMAVNRQECAIRLALSTNAVPTIRLTNRDHVIIFHC